MNDGERRLCEYKYQLSGSFFQALFGAIFKADTQNASALRLGFPEEVEAVWCFHNEKDYWQKLEAEYLRREK